MVNGASSIVRLGGTLVAAVVLLALACPCVPGWFTAGAGPKTEAKAVLPVQAVASRPPAPPPPPPPPVLLPPTVDEVLQSGVLIVISKASQRMYVFKDGKPWATSPVSTGRRGHATPAGVFPILQKRRFHRSNLYSNAPMPFMQRLTWSGIAIHGGRLPGYPASHGCIRLPHGFARSLFKLTRADRTTVVITNGSVKSNGRARTLALSAPMPERIAVPAPAQRPPTALAVAPPVPQIETGRTEPLPPRAPSGGQTIQLTAAASPSEAEAMWATLIGRHPELAGFRKSIIPAVVGERQVYRLRASAPEAHAYCAALKTKGTDCFNVT